MDQHFCYFRTFSNSAVYSKLDYRYSFRRVARWFRDDDGVVVIVYLPSIRRCEQGSRQK